MNAVSAAILQLGCADRCRRILAKRAFSYNRSGTIQRRFGLNPELDVWDAYATIHLLMPDGTMKLGGEAVAEVLRSLSNTKWFAWSFGVSIFGFRPFQTLLNVGYTILADVRPLFGCESCGTPSLWTRPLGWISKWGKAFFGGGRRRATTPHFSPRSGKERLESPGESIPQARPS